VPAKSEEKENETVHDEAAAEPEDGKPTRKASSASRAKRAGTPKEADHLDAPLFDSAGARHGEVRLPKVIFSEKVNTPVMHQAYVRQLANARQGTASTKTRETVSGGGAKPYRQKGTGRARHGSTREPSMKGGAVVFGPHPRSFAKRMPKQMRRLALRSALAVKASEGKVSVIEGFANMEVPKTRLIVDLLDALGVEGTALVVLAASNDVVARSAANLTWAKTILAHNLNLYDIFTHDHVVIAKDALDLIEETFA